MVRRKEDLRIRGFRLQCHEVVLRLVEEMEHSDLVGIFGDPEDEKISGDGGTTVTLQAQNRVLAERIAFGHCLEVLQRFQGSVREFGGGNWIPELLLDVGKGALKFPFGSWGKKNLKHGVLSGSRREPRTRPALCRRRDLARPARSLHRGLAGQEPCHRGRD